MAVADWFGGWLIGRVELGWVFLVAVLVGLVVWWGWLVGWVGWLT